MTNIVRYKDTGASSLDRGTTELWNGKDPGRHPAWMGDFGSGFGVADDFLDYPTGRYTFTNLTAVGTDATIALDDAKGGVILLDTASGTAAEGGQLQLNSTVGEVFFPNGNADVYFEARVKIDAANPDFFLGLSAIDASIFVTSANTSTDHIGFESVSADNVLLFHCESGGTRTAGTETVHTFVVDDWVKLGFVVKGTSEVIPYVNGVKLDSAKITTNIPTAGMVPTLAAAVDGTTAPVIAMDWWACLQLETIAH